MVCCPFGSRPWRLLVAPVAMLCSLGAASHAQQGLPPGQGLSPGQMMDLREVLVTGLRPESPSQFKYIDEVVARVQYGRLPESLVRSAFIYARKKRPYPIQYFDRALRILAHERRIRVVPVLKNKIQ